MQISHPLDVFVTSNLDRKILEIFVSETSKVSPRKRKYATETAVSLLRQTEAPSFHNALAMALGTIEKHEQMN